MQIVFLIVMLFSGSCTLTRQLGREISIDSTPKEAEVSYLSSSGQFKNIGKTPLTLESSLINEWRESQQGYAVIKISKSGYVVENLFIDLSGNYKVAYTANLKAIDVWNNKEMEMSSTAANKLAVSIQGINHLIFNKKFDEALANSEILIDQFPKAHVFYDMKGSILFLMGKRNEALASYQKSLSLNPDNLEAKKMLDRVKEGN